MSLSFSDNLETSKIGGKRTYVLDTSVLLSDPNAIYRFEEHDVFIPLTVVKELEKKRTDLSLGYFARKALHNLENLRVSNSGLTGKIPLPNEGTLRLGQDEPEGSSNDEKILLKASELSYEERVVVVSKDLPLRIMSSLKGLEAETYRNEIHTNEEWTGVEVLEVDFCYMETMFEKGYMEYRVGEEGHPPINTGVILKSGTSSALAVHLGSGFYQRIEDDEVFGVSGKSSEQQIAISHLKATDVGIVSLGGRAGTGKSALAILAGLEAVLEEQKYKKIIVFRPLFSVGGQDLGFLPGTQDEKMDPWAAAVYDTLGPLVSENVLDEVKARSIIEVLPLTHIRGRSFHDAFVIVDEAQNLERNTLLTVLSRMGQNSKIVLTHDIAQSDNLRVGRYEGIASVIEALKGNKLFAHIKLRKSERSAIAELVTGLLDF